METTLLTDKADRATSSLAAAMARTRYLVAGTTSSWPARLAPFPQRRQRLA